MVRPDEFSSPKLLTEVENYIDLRLKSGLLKFRLLDRFHKHKDLIISEYKSVGWSDVKIYAAGEREVDEYWQVEFVK